MIKVGSTQKLIFIERFMCLLFMCFWLMYLQEVVAVKVSEAAFQQMYSERSLEKHALYISFRDRKAVIEPPQRHVMELLLRWSCLPHFSEVNSNTIIVFFFSINYIETIPCWKGLTHCLKHYILPYLFLSSLLQVHVN